MLERFIEEIRRREKVIRIFPNIGSVERLVGALCAETHEEWSTSRRYLKTDEFYDWLDEQGDRHRIRTNQSHSSTRLHGDVLRTI